MINKGDYYINKHSQIPYRIVDNSTILINKKRLPCVIYTRADKDDGLCTSLLNVFEQEFEHAYSSVPNDELTML